MSNYARSLSFNKNGSLLVIGFDDFKTRIYELGTCDSGEYLDIEGGNKCVRDNSSIIIIIVVVLVVVLMVTGVIGFICWKRMRKVKKGAPQDQRTSGYTGSDIIVEE